MNDDLDTPQKPALVIHPDDSGVDLSKRDVAVILGGVFVFIVLVVVACAVLIRLVYQWLA